MNISGDQPKSYNLLRNTVIVLIALTTFWGCDSQAQTEVPDKLVLDTVVPVPDTIKTASFAFVGDLMCHSTQFQYATVGKDSYNFVPTFAEIAPVIRGVDFALGNLETTLTGKSPYSGYPQFNTPDAYLDAAVGAGFDFLVTANNHSMDKKEAGLVRTIEQIRKRNIGSTGTHLTQEDRDSLRIVDVEGFKIAILNYTYGTNGLPLPVGKPWSVNMIDTALIRQDIMAARASTAELVMVVYHFGAEYKREPDAYQKMAVNHAIACGADLIIGGHPHVVQPVDYFKTAPNARLDTGFVAYSLGNFISNQYKRYTDAGMVVKLELTRDLRNDSIYVSRASYVPTFVWRGRNEAKKIHVILPAEHYSQPELYPYLDAENIAKMKQAFEDTKGTVTKYTKNIELESVPAPK